MPTMTADLSTLQGISEARQDVFVSLMAGEISEQKANVADRLLRGQTHLKGDLRLKFLKLVCGLKGPAFEPHQATLTAELGKFLTPKALTE